MVDITSIDTTWAFGTPAYGPATGCDRLTVLFDYGRPSHNESEGESRHAWLASALQASAAGAYTDAYDPGSSIGSTHCARQAGGSHGSPK